jgi:hypothetical protein
MYNKIKNSVYDSVRFSIWNSVGRPVEESTEQKLCDINEEVLKCLMK